MTLTTKLLIVLIGLIIISCMNITFDFKTEFEGPFHQMYVDHMRHHQIEILKQAPKSFKDLI